MAAVSNDLARQDLQGNSSAKPFCGIPADQLLDHAAKVREEAWAIHPFPCIGRFHFLHYNFKGIEDEYTEVIQRLCQGQKLLDMACCVGQTIRYLVNGGAPSEQIYGCDLHPEYIEIGYKLFRDRDTLKTKFLSADVFDPNSALTELKGQMDMVFAGDFFHLWGYEKQFGACKRVATLLRPQSGSMILGRQVGAPQARETQGPSGVGVMFLHNMESFNKMWKEIGDELGVSFTVKTWFGLLSTRSLFFKKDEACRLSFAVRID